MAVSMIGPKFYAWDRDGKPLAFGKVYTYKARTNAPQVTYQSEDAVVANTNPVILNGEGYGNIYLDGSYKIVVKDKDDNEIWTEDPVTAQGGEEWVNCAMATYVTQSSLKVAGNVVDKYENGRRVRIDDGTIFSYSTILSSIFAGGETTITTTDAIITTGIEQICSSIVGTESLRGSAGVISASLYGFDSTGASGNGHLLNKLFLDYPSGFELLLDEPGGIYKWGDTPVFDNGVTYTVRGLGVGRDDAPYSTAPTICTYTENSEDVIRIKANDVRWLDMAWVGTNINHLLHQPNLFVLGYNGGSGNLARNFHATVNVWDLPGRFIDWVQGVHPVLKVRGSGGWGEFIFGRGPGEPGVYAGGDDQQNGQFDVALTRWNNWTMSYSAGSLMGAHNFIFWKQYSCVNGIDVPFGGNTGFIYSERVSQDHNGVPWRSNVGDNFIQFLGALDDSDWYVNDYVNTDGNGLANEYIRDGKKSIYLSRQDGYGLLYSRTPTMELEIFKREFIGAINMQVVSDRVIEIKGTQTNNPAEINFTHQNRDGGANLKTNMDQIGFMNNKDDSTQYLLDRLTKATVELTHVDGVSSIAAHSNFARVVTAAFPVADTSIDNILKGDILTVAPVFTLPDGITYRAMTITAGQVEIRIYNTTAAVINGPIAGDWVINNLSIVT